MNKEQFIEQYCHNCGSQRCEGIDSEWFDGCKKKWNLDGQDPASEIERLNKKVKELSMQIVKLQSNEKTNGQSRCYKCVYQTICPSHYRDNKGTCIGYKQDPTDGGYYG